MRFLKKSSRRFRNTIGAFALVFVLASPLANVAAALAAPTPSQVVQETSQQVISTLSERRAEFQADPAALHAFIRGEFTTIFDRTYAARLVLGRNGRGASDADVRAFADALAENLMSRYGNSLLEVDPGLNVKVLSETSFRGGSIVKVLSLIDRKTGAPVAVDYLFHQNAGRWQVFDVLVEGVSFVQTFRTQFDDELRSRSLAQITADLRANKIQADASTHKQ
jgi:phospholipid transport system substrate-binding protein